MLLLISNFLNIIIIIFVNLKIKFSLSIGFNFIFFIFYLINFFDLYLNFTFSLKFY